MFSFNQAAFLKDYMEEQATTRAKLKGKDDVQAEVTKLVINYVSLGYSARVVLGLEKSAPLFLGAMRCVVRSRCEDATRKYTQY